jgi:hypothetical protein
VKKGADPKRFKPFDLAIAMFGYKNHIGIDRAHGQFCKGDASAANTRARINIGVANSAYNFQRLAWLERRGAPA